MHGESDVAGIVADSVNSQKGRSQGQAVVQFGKGSEPDARLWFRKERETSRGSPRSFTSQKALVRG
jgi:hypothetical protein